MDKTDLRRSFLARRRALSSGERTQLSRSIAERFLARFATRNPTYIHCYLTIEKYNEVDTTEIISKIWQDFPEIKMVVPRVNFDLEEMDSVRFGPGSNLVENRWGIKEPSDSELIDTANIDMVLVPGLAFDLAGHRVGYGRGFYDRFLARCRSDCTKIALSYFEPVDRITGTHGGDVALDFLVTPFAVLQMPHVSNQPADL